MYATLTRISMSTLRSCSLSVLRYYHLLVVVPELVNVGDARASGAMVCTNHVAPARMQGVTHVVVPGRRALEAQLVEQLTPNHIVDKDDKLGIDSAVDINSGDAPPGQDMLCSHGYSDRCTRLNPNSQFESYFTVESLKW